MSVNVNELESFNKVRNIFTASFCDYNFIKFLINEGFAMDKSGFTRNWIETKDKTPGLSSYDNMFTMEIKYDHITISMQHSPHSGGNKYQKFLIKDNFVHAYNEALRQVKKW